MALFGRRKPAFQVSGLVCSADGLYDGSFVVACAQWWNHEIQAHPEMGRAGYRAFSADEDASPAWTQARPRKERKAA